MRLCLNDDLVFGIDGGQPAVALNDTFASGHLGRLVVGEVAFNDGTLGTSALDRVGCEPVAHLFGITREALNALGRFCVWCRFQFGIFLAVTRDHLLRFCFELGRACDKLSLCTALGFGCIAGQLDAVDGEHLVTDQPLLVADEEHLRKYLRDLVAERANEVGDSGEVRRGVAGQCNKDDVLTAGGLDVAAADDALTVGEEDDLEQHGGRICCCASDVVLVVGVEPAEVNLVIKQVIACMLNGARQALPLQVHRDQAGTGVDVFITRHLPLSLRP